VKPESGDKDLAGSVDSVDLRVVAGQLGRPPRGVTGVAARCPFGYPAVIETAPVLGGAPNPTLLYLTCPTMASAVSRAEAAGGVREFRAFVGVDVEAGRTLRTVTASYQARRAALAGEAQAQARLQAGIGGPRGPEKASCLHAYAAALLAVTSGWLQHGSGASTDYSASVHRVWQRFFPLLEEMWCRESDCTRFESVTDS
jgi:uncharacterized protein